MAVILRPISVAEIIKRGYLKQLDPSISEDGLLPGLYQYNEMAELDGSDPPLDGAQNQDQARRDAITLALQDKSQYVVDPLVSPCASDLSLAVV